MLSAIRKPFKLFYVFDAFGKIHFTFDKSSKCFDALLMFEFESIDSHSQYNHLNQFG